MLDSTAIKFILGFLAIVTTAMILLGAIVQ
jgi:hypothetical protein